MLISKTVEVLLSGTNIEYFENKDYKIPRRVDKQGRTNVKRGTKITVRTEDLPDNSDVLVAVQCDLSGIVYDNIKWYTYKKHVKEDGKYYHKIYTEKKKNKKRYVRGLSFYDWCYKYLSKKLADWIISRWDYELNVDRDGNSVSPKDVGRGSDGFNKDKRGYWFKCLDHPEHGSELKNIGRFTNNFKGFMGSIECIQCNCIALTHPHLVRYLVNKEDGYKYSMGSSEYVFIKCPDCGFEKEIRLTDLVRYNFSCKICSDQIPYSEKFTANLLRQLLKQDFIIQLTRKYKKWCGKYKYDFYTNTDNINCIIETHGQQHYDQTSGKWGTLEEIQQNDKDKEELAKSNNIENYIVIDCRKSELEWIKHNIMNRDPNRLDQPCLAEVLNFKEQDINWLKCHEFACSNLIKEVCSLWSSGIHDILTISEKVKIGDQTIRKYLKQGAELGWCDYKLTIKMKVICVTTGEIFESQAEATKKYKTKTGSISDCCKGVRKTTGILSDGSKLIWMYYEDYILKTEEEIENMIINKLTERKIFNKKEGSTRRISKVICLSTKEIFNTMTEAATKYNIPYTTISSCCRKLTFSAGKDLITGCPLVWMYYNEYILKTEDEIKIILNNERIPNHYNKKIICLTTRELFNNAYEAGIKYHIRADVISNCCDKDKPNKSTSKHPETKKRMVWMYHEEYILKNENEIKQIYDEAQTNSSARSVICLTTKEIFESILEAQKEYIGASHIGHCCQGKAISSGKLEDGTRLKWQYYDEYVKTI